MMKFEEVRGIVKGEGLNHDHALTKTTVLIKILDI